MTNPKIFVGNVAYATTKESLMAMFGAYGTVVDCYKPEQKGFAFVTMGSIEEAEKALAELQGKEVDGRELKLDEARPPKPRTGGFSRGPRRDFDND